MTLFVYSNMTKVITQLENWNFTIQLRWGLARYQGIELRKISPGLWHISRRESDVTVNVSEFQSISAKSSIWVSCAVSCQADYNLLIASSSISSPGVNTEHGEGGRLSLSQTSSEGFSGALKNSLESRSLDFFRLLPLVDDVPGACFIFHLWAGSPEIFSQHCSDCNDRDLAESLHV